MNKIKKFDIALLTASTVVLDKGIINSEDSKNFITFYDENGNPIENRITNLQDNKMTVYKFEYGDCKEYKRFEWTEYHNDQTDTIQIQTVLFNNSCQIEKIVSTDSVGNVTDMQSLTYDEKGRQAKEIDSNSKHKLDAFIIYSYPDSFEIDKKGFFGDSSFWYHSREYFDAKGNKLYSSSFDKENNEMVDQGRTEYIYKDGKITKTVTNDLKGKEIAETTFFYNRDGLIERTVSKSLNKEDDNETISTYRYTKRH